MLVEREKETFIYFLPEVVASVNRTHLSELVDENNPLSKGRNIPPPTLTVSVNRRICWRRETGEDEEKWFNPETRKFLLLLYIHVYHCLFSISGEIEPVCLVGNGSFVSLALPLYLLAFVRSFVQKAVVFSNVKNIFYVFKLLFLCTAVVTELLSAIYYKQ